MQLTDLCGGIVYGLETQLLSLTPLPPSPETAVSFQERGEASFCNEALLQYP